MSPYGDSQRILNNKKLKFLISILFMDIWKEVMVSNLELKSLAICSKCGSSIIEETKLTCCGKIGENTEICF